MKIVVILLLLPLWLISCGPAQDKPAGAERDRVARAEKLFNQAYQDLDVAIMDRLLSDRFEAEYPSQQAVKSRQQWLTELQGLRTVFPALEISVDSMAITTESEGVSVAAVREFRWRQGGESGSYRERYRSVWTDRSGEWQLERSTILPHP